MVFVYSMLWPPDSPWAPWWRTNKNTAEAICKLAKIKKGDILYDLGCGDGTLVIIVARNYNAMAVGIEIDPFRYLVTLLRVFKNRLWRKITVKRENFFKVSISDASVVVVYLVPKTLEKLKTKFLKELKPGTRVISYKYEMNLVKIEEDKKNHLFLYKV